VTLPFSMRFADLSVGPEDILVLRTGRFGGIHPWFFPGYMKFFIGGEDSDFPFRPMLPGVD